MPCESTYVGFDMDEVFRHGNGDEQTHTQAQESDKARASLIAQQAARERR